ncbi:MAG: hypothetical protein ACRDJW_01665 [Thermomicrobiales bacterium]
MTGYTRPMTCDVCGATAGPFHAVVFERDGVATEGHVCAACHADLRAFNADATEIARTVGLPARVPPSPDETMRNRES